MIFKPLPISGCYLLEPEWFEDERGRFARSFCKQQFIDAEIDFEICQSSVSINPHRGTLRGIHFQSAPWEEDKLIRCESGSFLDVMVDLRIDSPNFGQWHAVQLDQDSCKQLFLPKGTGHGFLTLVEHTTIGYSMSTPYHPEASAGVRYDCSELGITWPAQIELISERDQSLPTLSEVKQQLLHATRTP